MSNQMHSNVFSFFKKIIIIYYLLFFFLKKKIYRRCDKYFHLNCLNDKDFKYFKINKLCSFCEEIKIEVFCKIHLNGN